MRLTIIGCGDAFELGRAPVQLRASISPRAAARSWIDCGGRSSCLVALKAHKIDPNTIDAVILSHLHGDHFGGIPFLMLDGQYLNRRERPLLPSPGPNSSGSPSGNPRR